MPDAGQHHVVVGAGGIGRGIAERLAAAGHRVRLVSRSGRSPEGLPAGLSGLVEPAALDLLAPDAGERLATLTSGAASLVNAANPTSYGAWERQWPVMHAALLHAAERSGAGLVTVGNLYPYGRPAGPMTEDTPQRPCSVKGEIRARTWDEALAAHEAGRLRATELRASDYLGPGAGKGVSFAGEFVVAPAVAGRPVRNLLGRTDVPHSWTYLPDIAELGASLAMRGEDEVWGRVWHVPTAPPRTIAELAQDAARLARAPAARVGTMPGKPLLMRLVPTLRAAREMEYQFEMPFEIAAPRTEEVLGLRATPWEQVLRGTVAGLS